MNDQVQVLKKRFGPGTNIVTSNHWLSWQIPEQYCPVFRSLTSEDCEQLRVGDMIWKSEEFSTGRGKVYGGTAFQIIAISGSIHDPHGRAFTLCHPEIHYNSPTYIRAKQQSIPFRVLRDEPALIELSGRNDLLHKTNGGLLAQLSHSSGTYKVVPNIIEG